MGKGGAARSAYGPAMGRSISTPKHGIKYPNRLRELRSARGLTQQELAARVGMSQGAVGKLETGSRRLKFDQAARFAVALGVAPDGIMIDTPEAIPVLYRVAAFGADYEPADLALEAPTRFARPNLAIPDVDQCFGAEVADDSADAIYPRGSVVVARRVAGNGESLAIDGRTKYVVAFYRTSLEADDLMEILIGLLDVRIDGAITLVTRSSNRHVPNQPAIREATSHAQLGEATMTYLQDRRPGALPYRSERTDRGLILGKIEWAERPE